VQNGRFLEVLILNELVRKVRFCPCGCFLEFLRKKSGSPQKTAPKRQGTRVSWNDRRTWKSPEGQIRFVRGILRARHTTQCGNVPE